MPKKAFDKVQHLFMIKVLERAGIQETYLNIIKAINTKPTANIKLNGEKLKAVVLKSGTKQCCSLSIYLFVLFRVSVAVKKHHGHSNCYKVAQYKINSQKISSPSIYNDK